MIRYYLLMIAMLTASWATAQNEFKNQSISDLGNGKFQNPVVFSDFPDPDVIRVGDTFYMVTTTMVHFPGATIIKSKDLVNWEYCAQPLEQLATTDRYSLLNGQSAYASGMWACSMKYHNGKFHILINGNDAGGWLLTAADPEGKWEMKKLSRIYYDPGMLFDNGKVYVACGIGNIQMCELDEDFNFKQEKRVISDKSGLEGCHLYKIGDYYYIYATYGGWPSGQAIFRSKNIFGPYEEKMLVEKTINGQVNTVHQGALFDTTEGEWWTIMQEDKGALGRMPNLQPVTWADGWPTVGNNGVPYTTCTKPNVGATYEPKALPTNDPFRTYPLGMQWEWNHNPDASGWSLFERPGWLRLKALPADGVSESPAPLKQARNMLTQRIPVYHNKQTTPIKGTVKIDVSHLQEGDRAGICIFQDPYAFVCVEVKDGQKRLLWRQDIVSSGDIQPAEAVKTPNIGDEIYLRATINYSTSQTTFYFSLDNQSYKPIGQKTKMGFNLSVFVGARFGLFCYNQGGNSGNPGTSGESGNPGYADFDWFTTEDTFEESMFYPEEFVGYPEDMLTATSLSLSAEATEVMVGNSGRLDVIATYRDGHTENVAPLARYETSSQGVIEIRNGRITGIGEGVARVHVFYTDPLGHELTTQFTVRSTFFPFGEQYIKTDFFDNGTYNEATHTFKTGQYGQMGWEYTNGADMSDYKYLVINLGATSSGVHLNIFTENSIWSDGFESSDFGSKKQIVVNLQTAKTKNGKKLNTKNIHIVAFWGNKATIVVDDMYLTNNSDYTPSAVQTVKAGETLRSQQIYDLQGRRVSRESMKAGVYLMGGKKVLVK
jgi:beta-xylosidase